jgi:hypothetical protein
MGANCPICGDWLDERFLVRNNETEFRFSPVVILSFIASDIFKIVTLCVMLCL